MIAVSPRMEVVFVPRRRLVPADPPVPLADILIRLRGERGWLQKHVVERAPGIDQPYLSSLETGATRQPGEAKLRALDQAFDLEPGTLLYWLRHGPPWYQDDTPPPIRLIGEQGEDIARVWARLSREAQRHLVSYARYLSDQERAS